LKINPIKSFAELVQVALSRSSGNKAYLADGTEVVIFKRRLGHEVVYVQEIRVGRKKLTAF
jgi:hypothetical protein